MERITTNKTAATLKPEPTQHTKPTSVWAYIARHVLLLLIRHVRPDFCLQKDILFSVCERYMTYASYDDWDEFLLISSNLCLKYANRRRRWIHQFWVSRTDGEYFKLCKILTEPPDKFREYYRKNIKILNYTMDSVKDDLQGYCNLRKCIEAEEKLTVALRYVLVIVVRIKRNHICKILIAIIIQCNLKGNCTRKSKSYTKLK